MDIKVVPLEETEFVTHGVVCQVNLKRTQSQTVALKTSGRPTELQK